jgi:hypothetical protein
VIVWRKMCSAAVKFQIQNVFSCCEVSDSKFLLNHEVPKVKCREPGVPDSSVDIVTCLRSGQPRIRGSIRGRSQRIFFSPIL